VSEFPPHQRENHASTKKHTRVIDNGESLYERESDLKWCFICPTLGKERVHDTNPKYFKCLDL